MKVGIDTFGLEHGQSGLGSYLFYLTKNLSENSNIQYELFGYESDRYTYKANFDIEYKSVELADSVKAKTRWHFFKAHRFLKQQKYDVVIFAAGCRMLPRKIPSNLKTIVILNDLLSFNVNKKSERYISSSKLNVLKKVTKIVVPTNFIKTELVKLGISQNQIEVISIGIDHSLFYQHNLIEGDTLDIKPFAIKKPYLIYPTSINDIGKKHIQLIHAFNRLKKRTGFPHRLVLAGYLENDSSKNSYSSILQKTILDSPYASDIFLTGFFPHAEIGPLFSNADACIFPSCVEGVGLPIIENMACGVPVACAKSGALIEMSGENAIMFNSDDVEEMAFSVEKIIEDKNVRQDLILRGLDWASNFTWQKTAQKIESLILSLN